MIFLIPFAKYWLFNIMDTGRNVKIIVVGDNNVGKTHLLEKYLSNTFTENKTLTICDFYVKNIFHNEKYIKFYIWDTNGQERFRSVIETFYRNTNFALVVFDLTNKKSFDNVTYWLTKLKEKCNDANCICILMGSKNDLKHSRCVNQSDIDTIIKTHNVKYFETSAKENENIDALFEYIVTLCESNMYEINTKNSIKFKKEKKCRQCKYSCF